MRKYHKKNVQSMQRITWHDEWWRNGGVTCLLNDEDKERIVKNRIIVKNRKEIVNNCTAEKDKVCQHKRVVARMFT